MPRPARAISRALRRGPRCAAMASACAMLVLAAACEPAEHAIEARTPAKRIVLIVIDTLRADHLGIYGYARETAPFLAELAERGTVFDRAIATSSWTAPSTASIMTGLYPTRHGVVEGFFAHRQRASLARADGVAVQPITRLPSDAQLLAERLDAAGFATLGAASNINIGPLLGFDRGFDRFAYAEGQSADVLLAEVARWPELRADAPDRSFLYLHLNDVHVPYEPRKPWYQPPDSPDAQPIAAYDSEISFVDRQLEWLHAELGWDDDTLIFVVSDHGEEFGDHGGHRHDGGLHEELTRVVMIVSGAGVSRGRVVVDVSLVDVMPTLLDLAGVSAARDPELDGESLVPLIDGDETARASFEQRALLAHRAKMGRQHGAHWWAVVQGGWKLIVDGEARALYDQRADRRETRDLAGVESGRVRALGARLDALTQGGIRSGDADAEVLLDESMLEALEALGYVDTGDEAPAAATPGETPSADEHDAR